MKKRSQVEITQNKFSEFPSGSRTHGLPEYLLDALTTELWRTRKIYFPSNFDLRTLLHLFHFIQVTISLIIYPHLSFRHIEPSLAGHLSHKNLVYDLAYHESSMGQWLERPTGILLSNFDLRTPLHFFQSILTCLKPQT